jgi:hypothetical protein
MEADDDRGDTMTARDEARALVEELKTVLGPLLCGLGADNPPGTDDPVRLLRFVEAQLNDYAWRVGELLWKAGVYPDYAEEADDGCDED